ncbi:transmembrane 7 superfamily member 3-like [Glandiceps talaboti]
MSCQTLQKLTCLMYFILLPISHSFDVVPMEIKLGKPTDITLPRNARYKFTLANITDLNDTVAVFQIHTQYKNISASLGVVPTSDTAMNRSDVGLITELQIPQSIANWYVNNSYNQTVATQVTALLYKNDDPIPGACNFEFDLTNDPNIHLHYNIYETYIDFQKANVGWSRGGKQSLCDRPPPKPTPRLRLVYDVYQYFLPEHNLLESVLFDGLQKMSTVKSILKHGMKIATVDGSNKPTLSASSFHGQGVVYNIIVQDPLKGTSAAYVPVSSYGCSFTAKVDGCHMSASPTSLVTVTIFGVLGLMLCFAGHRYFKTEIFIFGFLMFALVFYIILGAIADLSHLVQLLVPAAFGLLGGSLLVLYWWRFGSEVWCVLVAGLLLGYLFASTVFFTPFGDLEVWVSNADYGLCFACFVLIIPVFLIYFAKQLNILSCCIVGSYLFIVAVSSYIYTSLGYIVLNPLKRVLMSDYDKAYTSVPFQRNDYILVTTWIVLTAAGLSVQFYRERGREFPPCPYKEWKRKRSEQTTPAERHIQGTENGEDDERRPLLPTV